MKNIFVPLSLFLLVSLCLGSCKGHHEEKKEDPAKTPIYRPIEHNKDSARA